VLSPLGRSSPRRGQSILPGAQRRKAIPTGWLFFFVRRNEHVDPEWQSSTQWKIPRRGTVPSVARERLKGAVNHAGRATKKVAEKPLPFFFWSGCVGFLGRVIWPTS